ncbi:hypothetical protein [Jeotgalibacillus sp. JSM ZJ347]|uniref:hypothetical protein n=1 Tax=Jeotgalibacillus sp. JSM ZJ347 TaxID=3342117 RepID=UPI0035A8F6BB
MSDKKFVMTVVSIVVALTLAFGSFNFFIDPMWTFAHEHELNDVQTVIDEREQKTSQVYFQDFNYDTILVGSSRSTYVDPHQFEGMDVFNYSVSNLSMREYRTMIDYALEESDGNLERVILGVDFFKSSEQEASQPKSILNYVSKVEERFYRYKNLLSLDVFDYTVQNVEMSASDDVKLERVYDRQNTADAAQLSEEEVQQDTDDKIERFRDVFYGENYEYYSRYKEIMELVKTDHPSLEYIVYTTPISTELFKVLAEEGHMDDYEQWLRDLVDIYGGVFNFMYPNSITNNIYNYFDGHHFYPEVGDHIAHTISGNTENTPDDFGVYVTKENIDQHLEEVNALVDELD